MGEGKSEGGSSEGDELAEDSADPDAELDRVGTWSEDDDGVWATIFSSRSELFRLIKPGGISARRPRPTEDEEWGSRFPPIDSKPAATSLAFARSRSARSRSLS